MAAPAVVGCGSAGTAGAEAAGVAAPVVVGCGSAGTAGAAAAGVAAPVVVGCGSAAATGAEVAAPVVISCGGAAAAGVAEITAPATAARASAEDSGTPPAGGASDTSGEGGFDCNAIVAVLCPVTCKNKTIPTAVTAATAQLASPKRVIQPNL